MPLYLRYLRILVSAFCGLGCVLLIVLWVRSYTRVEDIGGRFAGIVFRVVSVRARLVTNFALVPPSERGLSFDVNSELNNNTEAHDRDLSEISNKLGFGFFQEPSPCVIVPHRFAAFIAATLAAMPWIRWSKRFSTRTLLIATTLVAVVLGSIMWSMR
jgi:hypothetical protein